MDKVLDKRFKGRGFEYLVSWVGYPIEDAEWISGSRLSNCRDKVQEYEDGLSLARENVTHKNSVTKNR